MVDLGGKLRDMMWERRGERVRSWGRGSGLRMRIGFLGSFSRDFGHGHVRVRFMGRGSAPGFLPWGHSLGFLGRGSYIEVMGRRGVP
jgi:hypothetical protein